jgi:hypothetical protein
MAINISIPHQVHLSHLDWDGGRAQMIRAETPTKSPDYNSKTTVLLANQLLMSFVENGAV